MHAQNANNCGYYLLAFIISEQCVSSALCIKSGFFFKIVEIMKTTELYFAFGILG